MLREMKILMKILKVVSDQQSNSPYSLSAFTHTIQIVRMKKITNWDISTPFIRFHERVRESPWHREC